VSLQKKKIYGDRAQCVEDRMASMLCVYVALGFGLAQAFVSTSTYTSEGRPTGACAAFRHPMTTRLSTSEKRLLRLEDAFVELCSAVLHADDVGLGEKHATEMGPIFLDQSFNMSRSPLWLRAAVRDVLTKHDFAVRPIERKWNIHKRATDADTIDI